MSRWTPPLLALLALAAPAGAQSLPLVEDADWPALRAHVGRLLRQLESLKAPLPAETLRALRPLLEAEKPDDPAAASLALQKLLDPHCLLGININPESRVKARRGPRRAELPLGRPALRLVKVHNDGGVTHPLRVDSPQKRTPGGGDDPDRWLELALPGGRTAPNRLSGDKVEYRVLRLTARQAGKREATLAFDVGQGTQDLGFRAEVPVLFTVRRE